VIQHIVIVDDAEASLDILSAVVAHIPHTVSHRFTSSHDAMAWSAAHDVHAFLLDYTRPEPDGLAMIRMLRADPRFRLVPIVVVTADHEFDVRLNALAAGANDFIERPIDRREVLSRLRTLLAVEAARAGLVSHVDDLEDSLQAEEQRSRAQAERLATLWRAAHATNDAGDDDALQAVLREGAAAIRPGQRFAGSLLRVDGAFCVVLAAAQPEHAPALPAAPRPGERIPLSDVPYDLALRTGLTLTWDDVALEPAIATLSRVRASGVRAQICVPFDVGPVRYVLSFASLEPTAEPFRTDDHTYVNLLAAFFANRIQRAEQSQRLQHQADRLATLWRVANAAYDPDNEDALQAVLSEGAAGIRPGQLFLGCLMRVEGEHCVLLAAARPDDISRVIPATAPVGGRIPTAQMAEQFALEHGSTLSWEDACADPRLAALARVRALGERAMIATPFDVGRATYLLSFASQSPATDPFGTDDHTYVKLLADFFATRIQRAEHSNRLLHHLAHDALTGLRNRTQFRLDARAQLALHGSGAVAVISLDGFRAINEEYGHIVGDALLVEVGAALERAVTADDVVGRLAGDTFGAFLSGVTTEEQLRVRLGALAEVFTHPFSTGDREGKEYIPVGATFGAALALGKAEGIDPLLSHADTAVLVAKQRGRSSVEVYRAGMESEAATRARKSLDISQAIESGEFELYFQPHVDVRTMAVTGAEALIRWNHRACGLVMPEKFIPFAERHGLIRPITRWVMGAALSASERLRAVDPDFCLYFNLSAMDFTDAAIVDEFRAAAQAGRNLANIGVELTESAAMQDLGTAIRIVQHLQALGVRVAIDDFGTGYSSLSLLKRVPADIVKIDHSFIAEILAGARDAAIVETIVAGGTQLGYHTIAEGVESDAQLAWLRDHGCRYVQGYAVARPQPLAVFLDWLAARMPPARIA
jgi:diguanylate cyclase (GGDEF)-like protein